MTADGDLVVPIDAEAFGFWLKAAFGAPNPTGTSDETHIFKSGGWTLPSMAIEVAMPEVPRFAMYTGCVLDQLSWQMQRSGLLTATAKLIAQGETVATSTAAGTPTTWALQRFGHFNGSIKRNGTALGNIVTADIQFHNRPCHLHHRPGQQQRHHRRFQVRCTGAVRHRPVGRHPRY